MVDWSLARQVARLAAGSEPVGDLGVDLDELAESSQEHVGAYTGLRPSGAMPAAETVDRAQWAEVNLEALARLLGPVAGRLEERMGVAGPLAGPLRAVTGATLAAESGLVMGYMSQRVLGQYELSLLEAEASPRLLFVGPNLNKAVRELSAERDSFMRWIVLHELTHVLQFSGVPWLRDHLSKLMREYMKTVEVRVERGAAGGLPSWPDPQKIVEAFREGGLVALVQTREQRKIMEKIQPAMSVIEGYSEHVMDVVGEQVLSGYAGLRDGMERRRRSRSAPERILQRLLGLDMKMRQYEEGKAFCDGVVERGGIEGLNRVWESPKSLPTMAELKDLAAWVERTAAAAAA